MYCNKRNNPNNNSILKIIVLIFILGGVTIYGINYGNSKNNSNNTNNTNNSSYQNSISIIEKYNISNDVKNNIKLSWNKISGYGTSNIIKVLLNVEKGWLNVVYTDSAHNGLYIYSDVSAGYNYGNEIWDKDTKTTYREYMEKSFSIRLSSYPETYKLLSKNEFIQLLNEL